MILCYTCKRKSNKWPVLVFSNILDISAVNAYILFLTTNTNWNKKSQRRRRSFIEALGMALIQSHICRRDVLSWREAATKVVEKAQRQSKDFENSTAKTQSSASTCRKRGRCYFCISDNKFPNVSLP